MIDTNEMWGTNCVAWFEVKTSEMNAEEIKALIKDIERESGLLPQADAFGHRDDANWLVYGVYDSVGDNPDLDSGKDEEFLERWEFGINTLEIVDEKVLKDLYGKEDALLELKEKYNLQYKLYVCTFLDLYMEDSDGYGDNDVSLSVRAMAFLNKIGAYDYLRVMTYSSR